MEPRLSTDTRLSGATAPVSEGSEPAGQAEPFEEAAPFSGPAPSGRVGATGAEQRIRPSHVRQLQSSQSG